MKKKEKIISEFVLTVINDMNISSTITREEIAYIIERITQAYSNTENVTTLKTHLNKILNQILNNYKKYLPFCFASFMTAKSDLKNN